MMNLTTTQKKLIKIIFVNGSSSRSLLANDLSLTNAALTLSLKPLLEENIILEEKSLETKVGRKQVNLTLNPEYGYFFGIDVRKHNIYYSMMNFKGEIVSYSSNKIISLKDFVSPFLDKILGTGITLRGQISEDILNKKYPSLEEELKLVKGNKYIFNNVDALADIYSLYHNEDKNFLLVKYGPGVGSSIYVHGKSLGNKSELGHTYYNDKTVEENISYLTLLGKELEENEGNELILNDEFKLNKVLHILSFSLCNADSLLSLQKIILSGALLSNEEVKEKLNKELKKIESDFDTSKICIYPNYNEINIKKSSLGAFNEIFK